MATTREMEDFCRQEYPRLVQALTLFCGDPETARDLAHDALARACARWAKVQKMGAPGPWVIRMGMKLASSPLRRSLRPPPRIAPAGRDAGAAAVRAAVGGLPSRQRTALVLRHFVELGAVESAELMECDARTVRKLTRRAIEHVKRDAGLNRWIEASDAT